MLPAGPVGRARGSGSPAPGCWRRRVGRLQAEERLLRLPLKAFLFENYLLAQKKKKTNQMSKPGSIPSLTAERVSHSITPLTSAAALGAQPGLRLREAMLRAVLLPVGNVLPAFKALSRWLLSALRAARCSLTAHGLQFADAVPVIKGDASSVCACGVFCRVRFVLSACLWLPAALTTPAAFRVKVSGKRDVTGLQQRAAGGLPVAMCHL